jgi:hypothetical protein
MASGLQDNATGVFQSVNPEAAKPVLGKRVMRSRSVLMKRPVLADGLMTPSLFREALN